MAFFTGSSSVRRSELLNSLWHLGVRNYPVIGSFSDWFSKDMDEAYNRAGGKARVTEWVTQLYNMYRPEVVVTHDTSGEYGHPQHIMVSAAAVDAYEAEEVWPVKKLYLHLGGDESNQIEMDWDKPLASMDGKTGIQLAEEAFEYHVTQHKTKYNVAETGERYNNRLFSLARTRVGEDIAHDDFLENVDLPVKVPEREQPENSSAQQTVRQPWADIIPPLNEKGFLPSGEFVYFNDVDGLYIFINQTCKIIIERKTDSSKPLTWFAAEIWTDTAAGEIPQTLQYIPEKKETTKASASKIAVQHQAVFAMNTDYYTHRIGSRGKHHVGVEIRNGEVLFDDAAPTGNPYFPNLDVLAFFPDGHMEVFDSGEHSASEYLAMGADTTYSFGPYLIRDGRLNEFTHKSDRNDNPRCAIGMIEPGHYVAMLA